MGIGDVLENGNKPVNDKENEIDKAAPEDVIEGETDTYEGTS